MFYYFLFILPIFNCVVSFEIKKCSVDDPYSLNKINNYPFMVSLHDRNTGHFCSGTLISDRWVLTAAHCVYNRRDGVLSALKRKCCYAVVGCNCPLKRYIDRTNVYEIVGYVIYPDFNVSSYENDIACIKIKQKINLRNKIKSITVADADHQSSIDLHNSYKSCTNLGWVQNLEYYTPVNSSTNASSLLQNFEVNICDTATSKRVLANYSSESKFICATFTVDRSNKEVMLGDLGSPLVCGSPPVQFGIISKVISREKQSSKALGKKKTKDMDIITVVYTRVDPYESWIHDCMMGRWPMYAYVKAVSFAHSIIVNNFFIFILFVFTMYL